MDVKYVGSLGRPSGRAPLPRWLHRGSAARKRLALLDPGVPAPRWLASAGVSAACPGFLGWVFGLIWLGLELDLV